MKHCPKCHKDKELKHFSSDITKPDQKDYLCKICRSNYLKKWRAKRKQNGLSAVTAENYSLKQL